MKYTDENGNIIESSIDIKQAETLAKEKADLEAKHKTLEEEYGKLKSKDINFSAYRKATSEEKKKMEEGFDERTKTLYQEMDNVKTELNDYKSRNFQAYQDKLLDQLAGNDKDLRKQILDASQGFVGEVKSEQDMAMRLQNSYTLVKGTRPSINPSNTFVASEGNHENFYGDNKGERFTDTERGKKVLEESFPYLYKKSK